MIFMNIENLSKGYGNKILFDDISLGIHDGDKIGLIGGNGQGKTSLLKILAGVDREDSGNVSMGNNIKLEYLPQNIKFEEYLTVLEQVFRGESENIRLVRNYEQALTADKIDNKKIMQLTEEMDRKNAWELESEAKSVLGKLGIEDYNRKIGELSGGQKRRVALASALINPAEILILDEPTNHLDNDTIEWLEEYLKLRKGALLMVTHDRYFLNRVTNKIIELDNKKLYEYDGNYEYFIEKKAERQEMELASERKRQSIYRRELAWMKQGVKARGTRSKSRVDRFEDLKDSKLDINKDDFDISVKGNRLGKKIVEIENISKSYGDRQIIQNFFYTALRNDRIGILGKNGAGKSTLMDIIAGKIDADLGSVSIGETVKVGYFSQEIDDMDDDQRAIDYIKDSAEFIENGDGRKLTASQMMETFLFSGEDQWTPIKKLSGGERRRLYLLKVLMEGPNLLILDEPTNDLDINTLNVLEEYINNFRGPVIVVSHDRYFLDKVVDKVFYISDGDVREYTGNYTYFKKRQELEKTEPKEVSNKEIKKEEVSYRKNPTLKFSFNEKREWESIDGEIMEVELAIERIDSLMEDYQADYEKLEELLEEKSILEEKLEAKMNRWVELSELKEKIDRQ